MRISSSSVLMVERGSGAISSPKVRWTRTTGIYCAIADLESTVFMCAQSNNLGTNVKQLGERCCSSYSPQERHKYSSVGTCDNWRESVSTARRKRRTCVGYLISARKQTVCLQPLRRCATVNYYLKQHILRFNLPLSKGSNLPPRMPLDEAVSRI